MNIIMMAVSAILCFTALVLTDRFFKKEGLIVWISAATITANIVVCKSIDVLGFTASLGNVMFASNFLATDIICEKYGPSEARKGVLLGLVSSLLFLLSTQFALLYPPSVDDIAQESMRTLFSINLRVTVASEVMYLASNFLDVYLFEALRPKMPLWMRNNLATIVANCSENFLFVFFAFIGIYGMGTIVSIALTTCAIEAVIALIDTPFVYWATKKP